MVESTTVYSIPVATSLSDLLSKYRSSTLAQDFFILLLIPTGLAGVYYLTPETFQLSLAFNHQEPKLHTLLSHAYIHEHQSNDEHLLGNVQSYLLVALLGWLLSLIQFKRRRFWIASGVFLLLAPFIIAGFSYLILDIVMGERILYDYGFSGVVGCFVGFLFISAFDFIDQNFESTDGYYLVGVVSLMITSSFAVFLTGLLQLAFSVATGILVLGLIIGVRAGKISSGEKVYRWTKTCPVIALILFTGLFVAILMFIMSFPDVTATGGSFVNVFSHAAGILIGIIVTQLAS